MDRLSALPDEVIGHVLSFLPTTKSFVRTSILAKHWRFLWTRVSVLGFTVDDSKMINNIHNTIDDEFKSWIDTIYARNVRNIVIRLNNQLTLPQCFFNSNTLVDLCIIDSGDIRKGANVNFPFLKKLQLLNVSYDSEESLSNLIFGCPVLEELIIDQMIIARTVRTRNKLSGDRIMNFLYYRSSIKYLRLRASEINPYIWTTRELCHLVEADIDLSEGHFYSSHLVRDILEENSYIKGLPLSIRVQFYSSHLVRDLLEKLSNVKRLTFSSRPMEIAELPFYVKDLNFKNLTELDLRCDWRFIKIFFECAPKLRVLTICRTVDHNTQCWREPIHIEEGRINHLETVNLVGFGWSRNQEFEMVKYILRTAKTLKIMNLIYTQHYDLDPNEKDEALNRLALFKTISPCFSLRLLI